jgi:hypothetical protein
MVLRDDGAVAAASRNIDGDDQPPWHPARLG